MNIRELWVCDNEWRIVERDGAYYLQCQVATVEIPEWVTEQLSFDLHARIAALEAEAKALREELDAADATVEPIKRCIQQRDTAQAALADAIAESDEWEARANEQHAEKRAVEAALANARRAAIGECIDILDIQADAYGKTLPPNPRAKSAVEECARLARALAAEPEPKAETPKGGA